MMIKKLTAALLAGAILTASAVSASAVSASMAAGEDTCKWLTCAFAGVQCV